MARAHTTQRKVIATAAAWAVGLLIFFPILWTILTSFKTEADAIASPPKFLFFHWTLENYGIVQERSDYARFLWNSIVIAASAAFVRVMAIPASALRRASNASRSRFAVAGAWPVTRSVIGPS